MDTLRGNFGALDPHDLDSTPDVDDGVETAVEDEAVHPSPPPAIGQDERRMQVRAYNFWASLLEDRNFPLVEDLDPAALPDFGPHSVLLDFSAGIEDPSITFIGDKLVGECATSIDRLPQKLSQVPPRSLLSRITDHYMQILANQSPIGFEAEFVNNAGATILYRGILLPFSSDDQTIDFIYGVINWKELAAAGAVDELMLEFDQVLSDEEPEDEAPQRLGIVGALTDWADGPASGLASATGYDAAIPSPRPSFDLSGQPGIDRGFRESSASDTLLAAIYPASGETADMALADWLAAAREMVQEARSSEERTRGALYHAVGRAYDFALAAADAPEDFAELLADAGIAMQDRAPMTPVVKLVFGADYDKTRLTEYAAVLAFAQREGMPQGSLGDYLCSAEGGLKGVVAAERAFRRGHGEAEAAPVRTAPRNAIARKLRAIAPTRFDTIDQDGAEFALVMIRRSSAGHIDMLGEIPPDAGLIEKAARQLFG